MALMQQMRIYFSFYPHDVKITGQRMDQINKAWW